MCHNFINNLNCGEELADCYIIQDVRVGTTKNDSKYLSVNLKDNSGTIPAIMWNFCDLISEKDEGKTVYVEGTVNCYKDSLQINLAHIQLINPGDLDIFGVNVSDLVPVAPIDVDNTILYLDWIIQSMTDEDYKAICREMLNRYNNEIKVIPAAKSVHHSFRSGLLMHTANMLRLADYVSNIYVEAINRDLFLSGVFLHDFGKIKEFTVSELGLVTDYSTAGQLMGHSTICSEEIDEVGKLLSIPEEKVLLLKHLVLSHHGQPDFGAAVKPMCIEAELLSCIDMIDSRVEIYAEATAPLSAGEFTPKIYALDKRVFKHR